MATSAAQAGIAAVPALAQQENVYRRARGFQPAGTYSVSQLDSVNDVSGTVTLRIPLAKVAGRNGSGLSLDLIYNSALYNLQTQQATDALVMDYSNNMGPVPQHAERFNGGGWRYSHRYSLDIDSRSGANPGTRMTLVTGDSGSHQRGFACQWPHRTTTTASASTTSPARTSFGNNIGPNLTYYTTDGSFIRVEVMVGYSHHFTRSISEQKTAPPWKIVSLNRRVV